MASVNHFKMNVGVTSEYRVLIAAQTGEDSAVLQNALSENNLTSCACKSIEDVCTLISEGAGTALIAEEMLSPTNARQLVQTIQQQPEWSDFPFVIMASAWTDPDRLWWYMSNFGKSLNASVLERPVLTRTLVSAVRMSLRTRNAQYRIAKELQHRKEIEATLVVTNEELQAFSYSVSHDLRSPLSNIRGFSQILIEDYADKIDETGKNYLDRIIVNGNKMNDLINDLLKLSKVSRQEIHREEINITTIAWEVVSELRNNEPERSITITIQKELDTQADSRLVTIVLTNIIGNAWKFTSKTANPVIEVGSMRKDLKKVFFVHDNGAGFDMKHAEKLFKPFKRAHSDREFSGTGIGLAIVERIIMRHGGKIWAEGKPGNGTTFYFTFGME